jgi:hypothetical protein
MCGMCVVIRDICDQQLTYKNTYKNLNIGYYNIASDRLVTTH